MKHVLAAVLLCGCSGTTVPFDPGTFRLNARRADKTERVSWKASETAVIVCDMWDDHWCKGAAKRCAGLAPKLNDFLKAARSAGALIVHAPSDVIKFYEGTPQRALARQAPAAPTALEWRWRRHDPQREGVFPIDDSDNGCDDQPQCPIVTKPPPWKRQIAAIEIDARDAVSDQGREIYNLFVQRGIKNVFITGVHTNFCVLGRSFGIRQMSTAGMNVVLVRDLTDSLYNPRKRPFVSHDKGTELVVEHIERTWCPSILSSDVTSSLR